MSALPETITRRKRGGQQTYLRVGVEQHTRPDGTKTWFVVWQGACRACGARFYATSGASKTAIARGPGTVHCPEHRARATAAARARDAAFAARYGAGNAPS